MKQTKSIILYIYNSFGDPLFQNLMLSYIKNLKKNHAYLTFHLITFEQDNFRISNSERNELKKELKKYDISWYPQKFHTGSFLLLKKAYDVLSVILLVGWLRYKKKTSLIWAFANVAAAQAVIFSVLFKLKIIIFSYEPHSDFLKELGIWNENSLKYKILNNLEWYAGKHADVILTGTNYMVCKLKSIETKAKVFRAPTSVDEKEFYFRKGGRELIFSKHNIPLEKKVIIYIGKFGDLYYKHEIAEFLSQVKSKIEFHTIIITGNPVDEIKTLFKRYHFKEDELTITGNVSYEEIKLYISSADLGISAVPPTPSQRYRSPTKVAEYLLCGLPYITTRGISEDDIYAEKYDVGIVVRNFSLDEADKAVQKIQKYFLEDRIELKNRCRNVGLKYRSQKNIDRLLNNIFMNEI